MNNIINFNNRNDKLEPDNTIACETIFWCEFNNSDGTTTRLDLLKNKETNQIGIGIVKNYNHDEADEDITFKDVTIICDDEDNFIYNKLNKLLDGTR